MAVYSCCASLSVSLVAIQIPANPVNSRLISNSLFQLYHEHDGDLQETLIAWLLKHGLVPVDAIVEPRPTSLVLA